MHLTLFAKFSEEIISSKLNECGEHVTIKYVL